MPAAKSPWWGPILAGLVMVGGIQVWQKWRANRATQERQSQAARQRELQIEQERVAAERKTQQDLRYVQQLLEAQYIAVENQRQANERARSKAIVEIDNELVELGRLHEKHRQELSLTFITELGRMKGESLRARELRQSLARIETRMEALIDRRIGILAGDR